MRLRTLFSHSHPASCTHPAPPPYQTIQACTLTPYLTIQVVVMGGVQPEFRSRGVLIPDSANNNTFDPIAAEFFYRTCQAIPRLRI